VDGRTGHLRLAILTAAMALLAAGCANAPQTRSAMLAEAVRDYQEAVRWQRHDVAARFWPPDQRAGFVEGREALSRDVEIVEYDLVRVEMMPNKDDAIVRVELRWMRRDEGVLRQTALEQKWSFVPGGWRVVDEQRRSGAAIGLGR
jgi:hypothetical protein